MADDERQDEKAPDEEKPPTEGDLEDLELSEVDTEGVQGGRIPVFKREE